MTEASADLFEKTQPLGFVDTLQLAPAASEPDVSKPDAPEPAAPAPAAKAAPGPMRFEFTGSGTEYFRIWVVNLLLTILTLGVYSAWAKVRRLQYFYRNTRFNGAIFDYHGQPQAILKGRVLALILLVAYKIAIDLSVVAGIAVILVLVAMMPWLLARAFRFKMVNSSYRGLRFHFRGTVLEAYRTLILLPVILTLTGLFVWSIVTSYSQNPRISVILLALVLPLLALGVTVPMAHFLLKRYQHDNAYFGQTPLFFHTRAVFFFRIYGKAFGLFLLGTILAWLFTRLTQKSYAALTTLPFAPFFTLLYGIASAYISYLFVQPYLQSRIQNLVWNSTELGDHHFHSTASARVLLWIHASNFLLIALTFGLYKPFAAIRLVRYRVQQMTLLPNGPLEEFWASQSSVEAGALGQEAGDFFDIDIAL